MSDAQIKGLTAVTLFVEDLAAAKAFQETVFGKPLKFEDESSAAYDFDGVVVNLLASTAAPELVGPATDVDAECARLARHAGGREVGSTHPSPASADDHQVTAMYLLSV